MQRFLATLLLIAVMTWILPGQIFSLTRMKDAPKLMLWAWERPEDVRAFQGSQETGVAFLGATIRVSKSYCRTLPRRQPLFCAPNQYVIPVVRIETDRRNPPVFDETQIATVVSEIVKTASYPHCRGVQIDFDASKSERASYQTILYRVRRALPPEMYLSMTAIASWCTGDYWLAGLPVDEVVPMYFDMGVTANSQSQYLETIPDGNRVSIGKNCKCHSALGFSTAEIFPLRPTQYLGKRIYFFSNHPWQQLSESKKSDIAKILKYSEAS